LRRGARVFSGADGIPTALDSYGQSDAADWLVVGENVEMRDHSPLKNTYDVADGILRALGDLELTTGKVTCGSSEFQMVSGDAPFGNRPSASNFETVSAIVASGR